MPIPSGPLKIFTVSASPTLPKSEEATNGDLDIIVNTGGALGFKGPDLLKAVRTVSSRL